jgi:GDPmannose 4,6-dehydratase
VIATGQQHSVRQFVDQAASELGIRLAWEGTGVDEVARVVTAGAVSTGATTTVSGTAGPKPGDVVVRIDTRYFRPTEVDTLLGDPTKAREKLGWVARTSFSDLIREMVNSDLEIAQRDALVAREGYRVFHHHE